MIPTLYLLLSVLYAEWPSDEWAKSSPAEMGMDAQQLGVAKDYALTGGGSGLVIKGGKEVFSWGDQRRCYDLKSSTKSIGVTALGVAVGDGKMRLEDKAAKFYPDIGKEVASNADPDWLSEITLLHLATQTAGFDKNGGFSKMLFRPGTAWFYSDAGPNWLAECITLVYQRDMSELLFERVFTPIGITPADLTWRMNSYRPKQIEGITRREFGSGIHANVIAMARIGYLYLNRGKWKDRQLIPESFAAAAGSTVSSFKGLPEHASSSGFGDASNHYGLLWWNNADGTLKGVPRNAYWSWGLYESLIFVSPDDDLVVARAGKSWQGQSTHYGVLQPFFGPLLGSLKGKAKEREPTDVGLDKGASRYPNAPYPQSAVIRSVVWAPPDSIVRKAGGSDNWPVTWGDDDALYTAYGDGSGFEPKVKGKLSLGLAKVMGTPENFQGINIRSSTGEQIGDGVSGKKASGILMVDRVLYMFVRNAVNSQLAWSEDSGKTWEWSEWRFTESFGYPTFLNFGKNYAGARDDYVYLYSHDSDSAYKVADRYVMARVDRRRLRERDAYEFFVGKGDGKEEWTKDIKKRGGVFSHPGKCYRSGVSYNAGLKRYLWCQVLTGSKRGPRFEGGFGIYDAPEPWGPWTTVYFTEKWDVGPGETNSLPPKWMSKDGKVVHLVFSGDDCFSVRRAELAVNDF
ncbi:MAG: serine hydrolase [Planctomycetota bacterium]|nr:serine hydrolase [Planctomycetota bacterium]